jgi:hypothetical protein
MQPPGLRERGWKGEKERINFFMYANKEIIFAD